MNDLSYGARNVMALGYAVPAHPPRVVNAAGDVLRRLGPDTPADQLPERNELRNAFDVVENFRLAHQFPLNTFFMTLKNRISRVGAPCEPSSRNKRMASILDKLWERRTMNLTQMQDIAGCRAIFQNLKDVYALREIYVKQRFSHTRSGEEWERDYIDEPADSGYRSLHLKYRFKGKNQSAPYTGLRIEIQLRTELQHRWATAVEAAAIFTKSPLKHRRGRPHWLRFFALMGSIYALREGMPTVPGTPQKQGELVDEIRHLDSTHYIAETLEQFRGLRPQIEKRRASYFLIYLDPSPPNPQLRIKGFAQTAVAEAFGEYTAVESEIGAEDPRQVVLVSARNLRRAYPAYFLDTEAFLRDVRSAISG